MRKDDKGRIIMTPRQAAELFLLLSNARYKLNGKLKTSAQKYWEEFEKVLGLKP